MASQKLFQDNTDATKIVAMDPASVSTGTTRTLTMADRDVVVTDARTTVTDTSSGDQTVTFDGLQGEVRVYRNSGSNKLTINAGGSNTFAGGGTAIVADSDLDTVTLILNGTTIEIASTQPNVTNAVRMSVIDTSSGGQTVTFDGVEGEARAYRRDGANSLTIDAPNGTTFVGGGTTYSVTADDDTVTFTLKGTIIENLSSTPKLTEMISGVQGEILYHNGTDWVTLPTGTSGFVLSTNGAGANPSWISNSASVFQTTDTKISPTSAVTLDDPSGNEVAYTLSYSSSKAAGDEIGLLVDLTSDAGAGTQLLGAFAKEGANQLTISEDGLVAAGASSLAYSFVIDPDTGFGRNGTNTLSLTTAGTERINIGPDGLQAHTATMDNATGNETAYSLNYTTNKATSGNDTGLLISQTDTASPGTSYLIDTKVGGSSKWHVLNTGHQRGPQGTAGMPPYSFFDDTDTGLFQAASSEIGLSVDGSECLNIATADGLITATSTLNAPTGNESAFSLNYTTNKATSGDDTGLQITQTDTASPGTSRLIDAKVGGTTVFDVLNSAGGVARTESYNFLGATGFIGTGATTTNIRGTTINIDPSGTLTDYVRFSAPEVVPFGGMNLGGSNRWETIFGNKLDLEQSSAATEITMNAGTANQDVLLKFHELGTLRGAIGIVGASDNFLHLYSGNSLDLVINAENSAGNVGVGTLTPDANAKLHVEGNLTCGTGNDAVGATHALSIRASNDSYFSFGPDAMGHTNGVSVRAFTLSTGAITAPWTSWTCTDGNAGTPTYSFNNDPNSGMYSVGGDTLGFTLGGTLRVQYDPQGQQIHTAVLDNATGNETAFQFGYTTNKATSGDDTGLLISQTDTASPGTSLLIDAQVGGTSQFAVDNGGNIVLTEAADHSYPPAATKGIIWLKNDAPNKLYFTDDAGTDFDLTAGGSGAFTAADTKISPTSAVNLDDATGNEVGYTLSYTTNKATSGNDTGLLISQTDTASPGTSLLLDAQVGAATKFAVDNIGAVGIGGGVTADAQTTIIGGPDGALGSTVDRTLKLGDGTAQRTSMWMTGNATNGVELTCWDNFLYFSYVNGSGAHQSYPGIIRLDNLRWGIGHGASPNSQMDIRASAAANVVLISQGAASQTGALQEWRNSGGTALLQVDAGGDLVFDEKAVHSFAPVAGKGILWLKNDGPNKLYFTDDAGTDFDLTAGSVWTTTDSKISPTSAVNLDDPTGNETAYTLSYTTNKATSGDDTGLLISQTDTASPGTSNLIDAQVGGTTQFRVTNTGITYVSTPTASAALLFLGPLGSTGISIFNSSGQFIFRKGDGTTNTDCRMRKLIVDDDIQLVGTGSTYLWNDGAANTFAQRNGAAAQDWRVYHTWTNSTDYERFSVNWAANICYLETENQGTGSARDMRIRVPDGTQIQLSDVANSIDFSVAGTQKVIWGTSAYYPTTDNAYDIGNNTPKRFRTYYGVHADYSGQSLTTAEDTPLIDMATTWDTTGNPAAIKLNVTNTSSGATSKLLDLQVGAASQFAVDLQGNIVMDEAADHGTEFAAGKGIFWVKNAAPNTPMFTDDAGTDHDLLVGGPIAAQSVLGNATGSSAAPTAIAVGTEELVGRTAAGNVDGLTPAQARLVLRRAKKVLTYAATQNWDLADGLYFELTPTGNITTFNLPTNAAEGETAFMYIIQDGTGSRTISFATGYEFAGGTAPVLSTAANAVDRLEFFFDSATTCTVTILKDIK